MRIRYSAWTGLHEPFDSGLSAEDLLDDLADDLLDGGDVSAALSRLLRSGSAGHVGLDELRRRVAEARARELSRMGLDGPAQRLAEALQPIIDRERATVEAAGDDPAAMARRDELDALPSDPFGQVSALRDSEWFDAQAGQEFAQLLRQLRADVAQATFGQLAAGLANLQPGDVERMRQMLGELNDWIERLEQMEELERALGQRYPGARLEDIDAAVLEDVLDSTSAADLRTLREMERVLEQAGAVRRVHGRLELTPRGIRRLGERALAHIYQPARLGPAGMHATTASGGDGELAGTTRPLRFGDPFRLDVTRTVGNALRRRATDGAAHDRRVALVPDDFELAEAERRVQVVTALLLDMSFSMPLRGNWGPAKRVALALQALIASRFPQDQLVMIGFSDLARRLQPQDLLVAGWERVYGTNMEHAFALARRELERHPAAERQVIMITD